MLQTENLRENYREEQEKGPRSREKTKEGWEGKKQA
jgi:hypothetical protein